MAGSAVEVVVIGRDVRGTVRLVLREGQPIDSGGQLDELRSALGVYGATRGLGDFTLVCQSRPVDIDVSPAEAGVRDGEVARVRKAATASGGAPSPTSAAARRPRGVDDGGDDASAARDTATDAPGSPPIRLAAVDHGAFGQRRAARRRQQQQDKPSRDRGSLGSSSPGFPAGGSPLPSPFGSPEASPSAVLGEEWEAPSTRRRAAGAHALSNPPFPTPDNDLLDDATTEGFNVSGVLPLDDLDAKDAPPGSKPKRGRWGALKDKIKAKRERGGSKPGKDSDPRKPGDDWLKNSVLSLADSMRLSVASPGGASELRGTQATLPQDTALDGTLRSVGGADASGATMTTSRAGNTSRTTLGATSPSGKSSRRWAQLKSKLAPGRAGRRGDAQLDDAESISDAEAASGEEPEEAMDATWHSLAAQSVGGDEGQTNPGTGNNSSITRDAVDAPSQDAHGGGGGGKSAWSRLKRKLKHRGGGRREDDAAAGASDTPTTTGGRSPFARKDKSRKKNKRKDDGPSSPAHSHSTGRSRSEDDSSESGSCSGGSTSSSFEGAFMDQYQRPRGVAREEEEEEDNSRDDSDRGHRRRRRRGEEAPDRGRSGRGGVSRERERERRRRRRGDHNNDYDYGNDSEKRPRKSALSPRARPTSPAGDGHRRRRGRSSEEYYREKSRARHRVKFPPSLEAGAGAESEEEDAAAAASGDDSSGGEAPVGASGGEEAAAAAVAHYTSPSSGEDHDHDRDRPRSPRSPLVGGSRQRVHWGGTEGAPLTYQPALENRKRIGKAVDYKDAPPPPPPMQQQQQQQPPQTYTYTRGARVVTTTTGSPPPPTPDRRAGGTASGQGPPPQPKDEGGRWCWIPEPKRRSSRVAEDGPLAGLEGAVRGAAFGLAYTPDRWQWLADQQVASAPAGRIPDWRVKIKERLAAAKEGNPGGAGALVPADEDADVAARDAAAGEEEEEEEEEEDSSAGSGDGAPPRGKRARRRRGDQSLAPTVRDGYITRAADAASREHANPDVKLHLDHVPGFKIGDEVETIPGPMRHTQLHGRRGVVTGCEMVNGILHVVAKFPPPHYQQTILACDLRNWNDVRVADSGARR